MIVSGSCHDRGMTSTDSPLVTIITLLIGLILGLAIGFILWRKGASNGAGSSTELAEQLNAARAERDLYKSERDNAMADTKLAGELEAMKAAMEKLQKEAGDADRRRIEAESDIRTQVRAMSTHNESLVAQTKAIAGALSNSQTRGKFGEAQLELMLQDAGLHKDIEYTAQRSTTDADSSGIPDITVRMPGGTKLFIDSKFPFDRFIQAHEVDDPAERERRTEDVKRRQGARLAEYDALAERLFAMRGALLSDVLVVEAADGANPDLATLSAHVKQHLAAYKAPRHLVVVPTIGRAPNGKVDYKALVAQRTGTPVLFAYTEHRGDGFDVVFEAEEPALHDAALDIALTAMNRRVQAIAERDFRQYQWTYKRFSIRQDPNAKNPYK